MTVLSRTFYCPLILKLDILANNASTVDLNQNVQKKQEQSNLFQLDH